MCFRPAETGMTVTCNACGKEINEVPGFTMKACPYCKAELVRDTEPQRKPAAPAAAPKAAPAQPKVPMPKAPKPPSPTA